MKAFYTVLINSLLASVTTTFVWFALTFWVYLETKSVIATSVMAGIFTVTVAVSGIFLGSLVDRYPKKRMMLLSSVSTLTLFSLALLVYVTTDAALFKNPASPELWLFVVLGLLGALAGNLRGIALSTLVTLMVPEGERDKANGLVGTANGSAFLVASILSGLAIGFLGVTGMLICAVVVSLAVVAHLLTLTIPNLDRSKASAGVDANTDQLDLRGTIASVRAVPGLFGLIFFHTFNNFLGGVFMSLMDAYGLLLVSVQVWGTLWGVLSLGFMVGGIWVARNGLGPNPLRALFLSNIVMWTICIFFTAQASIVLMAVGMFIYLCLIPVVEAAEQTILQKVVVPERQGRVFGFAQSVEQSASPITAFLVGPLAQLVFIPFMTTGAGVDLIGAWYGVGVNRGLALLFSSAGLIGLIVTLVAMRSRAYHALSRGYARDAQPLVAASEGA